VTRSDEDLVAAWQRGDEAAFDALIDRFTPRVFGICHRYFGDPTDAEEATQETFVALLRRGGSFRGQSRFSTWLYRVATNVCHDLGRKRSRRPSTVPLDPDPDGGPPHGERLRDERATDAEDALLAAELGSELTAALRRIDVDQRTAIVLHDVYGYTYEEIAGRTDVAVGTAKSRVHRGHARLADELAHLRSRAPEPGSEERAVDPSRSEPSGPPEHPTP
jgi:RNA polymerase sigma-70 factor, ECF subfamily